MKNQKKYFSFFIYIYVLSSCSSVFIYKKFCHSDHISDDYFTVFKISSRLGCFNLCSFEKNCNFVLFSNEELCFFYLSFKDLSCDKQVKNNYTIFNKFYVSNCYNSGLLRDDGSCKCEIGFHGNFCQYNKCYPNPCLNNGTCHEGDASVDRFYCSCKHIYHGLHCNLAGIIHTKKINHSGGLNFGVWLNYKYCPTGYYANGFQLRVKPPGSDDTAVNNVMLLCSLPNNNEQGQSIKSGKAPEGDWYPKSYCPKNMYIVGFEIRLCPYKGILVDDYGVTDLRVYCRSMTLFNKNLVKISAPGGINIGDWLDEQEKCDENSFVCGINANIELNGAADKSGLNKVEFKCCKFE